MTFSDSVLHLVRAGARIDSWKGSEGADLAAAVATVPADARADTAAGPDALPVSSPTSDEARLQAPELAAEADQAVQEYEPGLADLEAAVGLVSAGLATRVILSGFPSWPGLLWQAYQLADTADVLILPTVVRPGGKVDIVITRDVAGDG